MSVIMRNVFDSGTVTMSASKQPQRQVSIPNHGDIKGFLIQITQSTTGTLTGGNVLCYCVDTVDLMDINNQPLWSNVRGRDFALLYLKGNKGKAISETTTSSSSATDLYFIPWRIDETRQEAKMTVNIAPYSNMATSGATGGSAQVVVFVVYDDDPSDKRTERLFRVQKSGSTGVNSFAPDIIKAKAITATYFKIGTESNLTDVTFSKDGSVELKTVVFNTLKNLDNALLISGHQSGMFDLYHSPYVWDSKSQLDFNLGGSDTIDLFFRTEEQ